MAGKSPKRNDYDPKEITRFSDIKTDKQIPFFEYYKPKPDPVIRHDKRKMGTTERKIIKPKIRMKCFKCKDKRPKKVENVEKKKIIEWNEKKKIENYSRDVPPVATTGIICTKEILRLPSPLHVAEALEKPEFKQISKLEREIIAKDAKYLEERAPKSRIIINKTHKPKEERKKFPPVDSIYYIYDKPYRKSHPWYVMFRGDDKTSLEQYGTCPFGPCPSTAPSSEEEEAEEEKCTFEYMKGYKPEESQDGKSKKGKPKKKSTAKTPDDASSEISYNNANKARPGTADVECDSCSCDADEMLGEDAWDFEMVSAQTSIDADAVKMKNPPNDQFDNEDLVPGAVDRIMQKCLSDTGIGVCKSESQVFIKRGTLASHSQSQVKKLPSKFFFGVKSATMHYGDPTFSEKSRYKQGLPMCVTAYIYSFIKPANKWNRQDMNKVLELGDTLYLKSLDQLHLHDTPRILNFDDLYPIVEYSDKKIKYKISDPDIAGFTRSEDPKVYNLLKGISLFFTRNRSGILQTYNTNILIWKQKHFYVFDPEPRNEELYYIETGNSVVASMYDVTAIASMLLNRGKIGNWPFIISKITLKSVTSDNKDDGDSITSDYREESMYKLISTKKAVINGQFCISDDCFGETKNKQGVAVATIALVYNNITPACSWHQRTVNKILHVANQFHIESVKDTVDKELCIENLRAFFTIGPLMVEIKVYANQFAGLMFRKSHCLFDELLQKFFFTNSSAIVEIDQYVLAIWRYRDVFYTFDPYSRDREGHKVKNGTACVTMNTNLETLVQTVLINFNNRDFVFKIHCLKIVKINRDPAYGRFPQKLIDSEASIIENIKISEKKSYKPQKVTVDRTEFAMKLTEVDEELHPSVIEIGSYIGSLEKKYIPYPPEPAAEIIQAIRNVPEEEKKVIDLDSASLSDTQIEKAQPRPFREGSYEFRQIEELVEPIETPPPSYDEEAGEGFDLDYLDLLGYTDNDRDGVDIPTKDQIIQIGVDKRLLPHADQKVNTDLLGLAQLPKVILEPNKPPRPHKKSMKFHDRVVLAVPSLTQDEELKKKTNFVKLPDDSEILHGTKNITQFGDEYEFAAPFVSAVAILMEQKYGLNTWNPRVIDTVLDYGWAVYTTADLKYTDAPRIILPKISIGQDSYTLTISYLFDSLLVESILKQSLSKLVFRERESCIIVTQDYCCAVFYKRKLYYLYDGFNCNLVGLGEGPENNGSACMLRFKGLQPLIDRFIFNKKRREIAEPTEATRFIISSVEVEEIPKQGPEKIPRPDKTFTYKTDIEVGGSRPYFETNPTKLSRNSTDRKVDPEETFYTKNRVGYHSKNHYYVLEGSQCLQKRNEGQGEVKACHFVGVCAMIGIFGRPIKQWDTQRVDYVIETGKKLFGYVDKISFADKRNITNLLFDKHFYDVIVKRLIISNRKKKFIASVQLLLIKNRFLLLQFPNCCFVLYRGVKLLHLFDPYGSGETPKACWIKFDDLSNLVQYINVNVKFPSAYDFYTIYISRLKKASKKDKMAYKLHTTNIKRKKKHKKTKVIYEDEDWLVVYPIPWSRMKKELACGRPRGTKDLKWYAWDVEYPEDLYSLVSSIHQTSLEFAKKSRGKQTIANCIVAIVMTEIYHLCQWNTSVMDTIIRDGNQYFNESVKKITKENYEVRVEDFEKSVLVFPYSITVSIVPLLEGTMYLLKEDQFNLGKALECFFEVYENRCGIICCTNATRTKYLAFGRIRDHEYFMYDCSANGPPMFLDPENSKAYILRCVTLNRLIHVITVILRSGDFFIYTVGLSEDEKQMNVTQYDDGPE